MVNNMKNFIKTIFLASTVLIASCGGGGSGGGTPTGPSATLRLYPPISGISLPVGASGSTDVEVRGGRPPYVVTSSDASVSVGLTPENILLVRGNSEGSSDVVVYDTSLPVQQVKITITAKAVPMASSVGTSLSLAPFESRQFNIRGGAMPYSVSSSDAGVVTASISGSTVTLVGQPKGGTATVLVTDAAGATLSIAVTVQVTTLSMSPGVITGPAGTSNSFVVSGGLAPYTVSSSNTTVATAAVSGASVSVSLRAQGNATITVSDATGKAVTGTVTVTNNAFTVAPATQQVPETSNAAVTFLITGGTAPYTPLISVADAVNTSVSITATTLTVTVPGGQNRCVTADRSIPIDIYDATLAKQTVTLTIKDGGAAACP